MVRASLVRGPDWYSESCLVSLKRGSGDDGEVLDVMPEEVAEPHGGSDAFYINRWSCLFDALQLGLAWFDSFRS